MSTLSDTCRDLTLSLPPIPGLKSARVAVAMSGGVDSSMVAYLLSQAGFTNLIGFTAWTLNGPGKCCNDALINAGRVCEELGMEYDTVDLRAKFSHFVMDHYEASYQDGLTPNPCVECNRHVKWEALIEYARQALQADFVATGHYAKIQHAPEGGLPTIYRGQDLKKDQSYMLARVRPEDLRYTLFPLADIEKTDLVDVAKSVAIPTAHSKESQDVCFVLNGQANYLKGLLGSQPGDIIDLDTGRVLGQHEGYYLFTLGQRKGLAVAAGRPVYVVKIDKDTNTVYVGDTHHLERNTVEVVDASWIRRPVLDLDSLDSKGCFEAMVKYRYNTPPAKARCQILPGENVAVTFDEPVTALSPGQIAAFYDLDFNELYGGGYIQRHLAQAEFDPAAAKLPSFDEACQLFR
jgi:tRNA-uridine 2-sulfurtransferase